MARSRNVWTWARETLTSRPAEPPGGPHLADSSPSSRRSSSAAVSTVRSGRSHATSAPARRPERPATTSVGRKPRTRSSTKPPPTADVPPAQDTGHTSCNLIRLMPARMRPTRLRVEERHFPIATKVDETDRFVIYFARNRHLRAPEALTEGRSGVSSRGSGRLLQARAYPRPVPASGTHQLPRRSSHPGGPRQGEHSPTRRGIPLLPTFSAQFAGVGEAALGVVQ